MALACHLHGQSRNKTQKQLIKLLQMEVAKQSTQVAPHIFLVYITPDHTLSISQLFIGFY
jgi:hypothetical protein